MDLIRYRIKNNKYNIGQQVTIIKTNPGYSGMISGILTCYDYLGLYPDPEHLIAEWTKMLEVTEQELRSYFIYIINFDRRVTAAPVPEWATKEEIEARKNHNIIAHELDIMDTEEYWNKVQAEINKGE